MMYEQITAILKDAQKIVVIQADNPDADSLGSALAFEHILGDMGKDVALYCGVIIPDYLRYLQGWDRVISELPSQFDASVIVDASTYTLLEKLETSGKLSWLKNKPCIILDHHTSVERPLDFATVMLVDNSVASTGELIHKVATQLQWTISSEAANNLMVSILGDTQGLTNELTTAGTYRCMAALTELGADRPTLEELRREYGKMVPKIYAYKAELIARTEFLLDGRIASVTLGQAELNEYSPLYNPVPLIQSDMLQIRGIVLSIVFKVYDDGRITAAIRTNHGYPIAGKLAEAMGGGGHPHASGFKIVDGRPFDEVKSACMDKVAALLEEINPGDIDEAVQHTF